jgi:hypothetical protein
MSSPMPRRSIVGPVHRQHHVLGLSFNHIQLSRSILPHISIHRIHTLHLQSVVHQMKMLLHRIHTIHLHHIATHHIHTLLPQPVVCRVVLPINHIHTLHLNMFTSELVTTQVTGRIYLIQLKLLQIQRNEMSGLTTTRKI